MELTKISSKGQIVIPQNIREQVGLSEGETLVVSAQDKLIVIKKIKINNPLEAEDMRTLEEIKESWREIAANKYKKMSSDEFLKEISKW